MPSQEEIDEQQGLLSTYRKTLAILLEQQAQHTKAYTPPAIEHGIREARANIRRVKKTLQDWGVSVVEHPDDRGEAFTPSPSPVPSHNILAWRVGLATIAALFIAFGIWFWQNVMEPKPPQSLQPVATLTAVPTAILTPTVLAIAPSVVSTPEGSPSVISMNLNTTEGQAIATATAAVAVNQELSYGPSKNVLQLSSSHVSGFSTNTNLLNFVVSARFYNPYSLSEGPWSYGFVFRATSTTNYNLIIAGAEEPFWVIAVQENGKGRDVVGKQPGQVFKIDTSPNGYNDVALVVIDENAILFVNGKFIDKVNLPEYVTSGRISVISGIYGALDGKSIKYENFTIRKLP